MIVGELVLQNNVVNSIMLLLVIPWVEECSAGVRWLLLWGTAIQNKLSSISHGNPEGSETPMIQLVLIEILGSSTCSI